jgi:hypothetical protein
MPRIPSTPCGRLPGAGDVPVAVEQSSGQDRLNIHGAIDLETGQTVMRDGLTADDLSTIMLPMAIEAIYLGMRFVQVFLSNRMALIA